MGEAVNLVNILKVKKVIFNCGELNDLESSLIKVLEAKKIPYQSYINELDIDNYQLNFLNTKVFGDENNNSIVIYTKLDGYKFVFMGDAVIEQEKDILDKYNLANKEVLNNLSDSKIYRTDQDGSIMLKFYELNEKVQTLSAQLSWPYYCELLSFENTDKINYYIELVKNNNLSVRQLRERIKSNEYERLPESTKNKSVEQKESDIVDFIKNPILIKNSNKYDIFSEKVLQKLILEDIENFLEELGIGFTFIKSEYPIKLGNRYNYIDLLLYNIKYRCYVVVELKITELKKEHTGQIMTYMNYIDKNIKTIEENDTVGIIICKQDNSYCIKYCSDDRIIAREYELV